MCTINLQDNEMAELQMPDIRFETTEDSQQNNIYKDSAANESELVEIPLNGSTKQGNNQRQSEDEMFQTSLVYTKHMKIEVKDVSNEVRALKEVDRFLENPTVLLNIHETRLDDITGPPTSRGPCIIDTILKKLITNNEGIVVEGEEARNAFFTKDSVHHLSHVIQGTEKAEGSGWEEAQNWLIAMGELSWLSRSYVAMATLRHATNLGRTLQETHLVVLILSPRKTKKTKSSLETGRTFATILADIEIRQQLIESENEEEFLSVLSDCHKSMVSGEHQKRKRRVGARRTSSFVQSEEDDKEQIKKSLFSFGRGIVDDVKRRWPHYPSDFYDGWRGHRSVHKLASTVFFLYFACLLPSIAFGVLNSKNTEGKIGVKEVIIAQSVSGILYALLSGQPLIVLLTTAPLALFVKVMYDICDDMDLDFHAMYTMTGLWNTFFLVLYSVFGASYVMRWSTRSINEIFALFISVAFAVASFESIYKEYSHPHCRPIPLSGNVSSNATCNGVESDECFCTREGGTLYILLSCGCVLLGVTLYNFKKSPLLDANKREALADYALPVSVIFFSILGSFIFKEVTMQKQSYDTMIQLRLPTFSSLSVGAVFGSCGLGFSLSLLFFVEQNIGSAIVNSPSNRLKKGTAYHLDLLVIGVLNGFLSLFGLPWVHAALPHSPLHVRALADVEERVDQGHVFDIIVKVRETRLSIIISHVMIGLSILMIPTPLDYIPNAVLDGLFLFVAITPLYNNQMFERSLLLFTEQCAYPPNHYIRRVPQRKIHQYTGIQLLQLAVICGFGFFGSSYTKMFFPVLLILLVPVRHAFVPKLIDHKFLDAMDANL